MLIVISDATLYAAKKLKAIIKQFLSSFAADNIQSSIQYGLFKTIANRRQIIYGRIILEWFCLERH